jgi:hypothetical protein
MNSPSSVGEFNGLEATDGILSGGKRIGGEPLRETGTEAGGLKDENMPDVVDAGPGWGWK